MAKDMTKKAVAMVGKQSAPLSIACQKASEILQEAKDAGLEENQEVQDFAMQVEEIEDWKKKAAGAVAYFAKNPIAELAALPFGTEKQCT